MRFIILDSSNKIIATREGTTAVIGELQSDNGELGQIMKPDGTFITPVPDTVTPQPTLEDKINFIYYKQMGVI